MYSPRRWARSRQHVGTGARAPPLAANDCEKVLRTHTTVRPHCTQNHRLSSKTGLCPIFCAWLRCPKLRATRCICGGSARHLGRVGVGSYKRSWLKAGRALAYVAMITPVDVTSLATSFIGAEREVLPKSFLPLPSITGNVISRRRSRRLASDSCG